MSLSNQKDIDLGNHLFDGVFEHSYHFRVQMPHDAAVQFIRRIGGYNEFDAETVIDALERIDRLIPRDRYGEGNLNNGKRSYEISVGRESSPVIYLERWVWREENLSPETCDTIRREMELSGKADESSCHRDGHRLEFRFWWD